MFKYTSLITSMSVQVRKLLNVDNTKPINIYQELIKHNDFTIVILPLSQNIRGFSHNEDGHKIIIINANDSKPQQNFSIAHELYHLYFNYNKNKHFTGSERQNERMADKFSGTFLIPQECLFRYLQEHDIDTLKMNNKQLCEMEHYFGVSRSALLIRLLEEGLINKELKEKYRKNIIFNAVNNGFDASYYEQNEDKFEIVGEYISLATELFEQGKISRSKYKITY